MSRKKCFASACAALLLLTLLGGCQSESSPQEGFYDSDIQSSEISDTWIAENENYRLNLNETSMGITLTDRKTGRTYGTNPQAVGEQQFDEFGMPIKRHPQVESALFIEYLDVEKNTTAKLISYSAAVKGGRTVCEKVENGIRISYYFDDARIMIPLTYTLRETGVAVTLNPQEIQEDGNMLISVSLAPFWCAVSNTESDGYLLYPSGSGALIYAKELSQPGESYSDEVYGPDAAKETWDKTSTTKAIRLPVFGAKSGDTATCGIIEQGAESCLLDLTVGSTSLGYSSVYVTYQVRGYTANIKELYNNRYYKGLVYADDKIDAPLTVGYYPLSGADADYSGMAAVYREYLNATVGEVSDAKASALSITAIGGARIARSFLGIPYQTLLPTTTVDQATEILTDLQNSGVEVSAFTLSGYGKYGVDTVKLAGGFGMAAKLGAGQSLRTLQTACGEATDLYFDFDTVAFSQSGCGFSSYFDSAVRANRKQAKVYDYEIALLGRKTDSAYSLLARDRFADVAEKLLTQVGKWKLNGIGLSSLSNTAYSDYTDKADSGYYAKANFGGQVTQVYDRIGKAGLKLVSQDANVYAAVRSDAVLDSPTTSNAALVFDADIPFYQMALRGRTALSCESINLVSDPSEQLLRAVESGSGLAYTVIAEYDTALIDDNRPIFYNSRYSDLKEDIVSASQKLSGYYAKIGGSEIRSHRIDASGLRETVYANGVTVFVNYTAQELSSPAGRVPAKGFLVWEDNV